MLPIVHNFERILSHQADEPRCSQEVDNIRLTYRNFQNALKRNGIELIDALNRLFDPDVQKATAMVEYLSHPGGVMIELIKRGYLRDGGLLRPAKVWD